MSDENMSEVPISSDAEKFALSLAPWVERALHESVKRNPDPIVEVVSPVIGKSISKAISDFFEATIQSLDRALELSLSPEGVKWRIESLRTGVPFSEIVTLRSAKFSVERLTVVHRQLGVALAQVEQPSVAVKSAGDVSGLFIALQEFVKEAYAKLDPSEVQEGIRAFHLDQEVIFVETGPQCALAAFISGRPPSVLRRRMRAALDEIHRSHARELEEFDGDISSFCGIPKVLAPCLLQNRTSKEASPKRRKVSPGKILLGLLALGSLILLVTSYLQNRKAGSFEAALRSAPGYYLSEFGKSGGKFRIKGYRDPFASSMDSIAQSVGYVADDFAAQWKPFVSLEPEVFTRRFQFVMSPPPLLRLQFDSLKQEWVLSGVVSRRWINANEGKLQAFFGALNWRRDLVVH